MVMVYGIMDSIKKATILKYLKIYKVTTTNYYFIKIGTMLNF
jgi:hypothetical protein